MFLLSTTNMHVKIIHFWEKPELIVLRYAYIKAKAFHFCNVLHLESSTNASIKFNKEQESVSV
jgi:hypothetical protein